jgi:hypothetical protein
MSGVQTQIIPGGSYPQTIVLPTSPLYKQLFPGYTPTMTEYGPGGSASGSDGSGNGILPGDVGIAAETFAPAANSSTSAPSSSTGFGPSLPGGYTTANPGAGTGWFYNSQTGQFEYAPGNGAAPTTTAPNSSGQQVPGLGGVLNPMGTAVANAIPKLSWIEEIAIRLAMVFAGMVLIFAGYHVAAARGGLANPKALVR